MVFGCLADEGQGLPLGYLSTRRGIVTLLCDYHHLRSFRVWSASAGPADILHRQSLLLTGGVRVLLLPIAGPSVHDKALGIYVYTLLPTVWSDELLVARLGFR